MPAKKTLPKLNLADNPTGCCPRFDPKGWDNQEFVFNKKKFVVGHATSFFYIPLNMGSMMKKLWAAITLADAYKDGEFLMLSRDLSPWKSQHYLSVNKNVPSLENTTLSGTFRTKVFEGPFKDAPKWIKEMNAKTVYLYYTTCPKCVKVYGKNYVVAFAKV